MSIEDDLKDKTMENLVDGISSSSFDLGVWDGWSQVSKFIRGWATQKWGEEKDEEAKLGRELAKVVEAKADLLRKKYDLEGGVLREACWEKLASWEYRKKEKVDERVTRKNERPQSDYQIHPVGTPEKPIEIKKGRQGHPNWKAGPRWDKTEDEILMDAVLEAISDGKFKHGEKTEFFTGLTVLFDNRTWSGIASRWSVLSRTDTFTKKKDALIKKLTEEKGK